MSRYQHIPERRWTMSRVESRTCGGCDQTNNKKNTRCVGCGMTL